MWYRFRGIVKGGREEGVSGDLHGSEQCLQAESEELVDKCRELLREVKENFRRCLTQKKLKDYWVSVFNSFCRILGTAQCVADQVKCQILPDIWKILIGPHHRRMEAFQK